MAEWHDIPHCANCEHWGFDGCSIDGPGETMNAEACDEFEPDEAWREAQKEQDDG